MSDPRTCIVIGAGGGVGRELIQRLAADDWRLVLAGRTQSTLNDAASTVSDHVEGTAELDARDFDAVDELFKTHEHVAGAVNLAGSILLKPSQSTSADEFEETMGLNARTAFAVTRAASKAMRKTGGAVVLMSSCAAQMGLMNHEAISAAKGAVEGLTRAAAASGSPFGLRVNAVAPGLTDTPMAAPLVKNDTSRKASEAMHPLGRIGEPAEIARAIAFLLHPDSSWITGQVFGVDGGLAKVKGR